MTERTIGGAAIVLILFGCNQPLKPQKGAASPVAKPDLAKVQAAEPLGPPTFSSDMKGQLDRVDWFIAKVGIGYPGDQDKYRAITGWRDPKTLPGAVYALSGRAQLEADQMGGRVTFSMLKKNPDRYATRAWACEKAKIVEINEREGITQARIQTDEGIYFVIGRFQTDFVDGDRVDVMGFLAGNYTYESQAKWQITLPAVAAGGFFKGGTTAKMTAEIKRALKVH